LNKIVGAIFENRSGNRIQETIAYFFLILKEDGLKKHVKMIKKKGLIARFLKLLSPENNKETKV
jgi:hypothetical protein